MDKKIIGYVIVGLFILLLALGSFGILNFKKLIVSSSNDNNNILSNDGLPEKCRVPKGESINSWKDHLGHHPETRDCLKYFN